MNDMAIAYLEQARELADNSRLPIHSRALMLYRLAGQADGYGIAMLDAKADIEYQSGVGPALCETAQTIQAMAEKLLGYEKP